MRLAVIALTLGLFGTTTTSAWADEVFDGSGEAFAPPRDIPVAEIGRRASFSDPTKAPPADDRQGNRAPEVLRISANPDEYYTVPQNH